MGECSDSGFGAVPMFTSLSSKTVQMDPPSHFFGEGLPGALGKCPKRPPDQARDGRPTGAIGSGLGLMVNRGAARMLQGSHEPPGTGQAKMKPTQTEIRSTRLRETRRRRRS